MNASMSDLPTISLAEAIQITWDTQIVTYINVISLALFAYDSLLTLGDEAQVMWRQKINPGAVLYYLSRYVGLINTLLNVALGFVDLTSESTCDIVNIILNICFLASFIGTNGLFAARAYALCGMRKVVLAILLGLFVCDIIPILLQMIVVPGCNLSQQQFNFLSILSVIQIIILIVLDTVQFSITAYQAYHAWSIRKDLPFTQSVPNLVGILFHQGVLRYCFVLVVTVAQAIIERKARPSIQGVLGPLQQTLAVLLLCRFSLDLRLRAASQSVVSETSSDSKTCQSLPPQQTDLYDTSGSVVEDLGLESAKKYSSSIQRAVQYIHKELVNEFGETSSHSGSTVVDPYSHSTTSKDTTRANEIDEPMLLEVDFGDFQWPGNRGSKLFDFTIDV